MASSIATSPPSRTFRRLTTHKNLAEIFEIRVSKGQVRGRDGMSPSAVASDLTSVIPIVSERLRSGAYKFTPYRQRLFSKGAGRKPREVSIPTVRDRIALRAITDLLISVFPESTGKIPQAVVDRLMESLKETSYDAFVRIDVSDFYPSIDHAILLDQLGRRIKSRSVVRLVKRAITTPTVADRESTPKRGPQAGVPQGLSISNILAEIYMRPVDDEMSIVPNIAYHRFVDDILILCPQSLTKDIDLHCRKLLEAARLEAHPCEPGGKSDIGKLDDGFSYLGYSIKSGTIGVRRSSIIGVETHLARIHSDWRRRTTQDPTAESSSVQWFAWHRNIAITGCIFEGEARGWIPYFRQLNDLRILKRLDATVARLTKRYGATSTPRPKTFMRAYWAINSARPRDRNYIPDFNNYGPNEMAKELSKLGISTITMSETKVRERFYQIVRAAVEDMERDIGSIS